VKCNNLDINYLCHCHSVNNNVEVIFMSHQTKLPWWRKKT
jgi:hypothetical protein